MTTARRIYIVDDDQDVVYLMTARLEARGHRVKSNTVGALAIPAIVEMRPHRVLLDLVMAEIDGYGMAGELKKRRDAALEAHDGGQLKSLRRQIHRLNRQIRAHTA